MAIGKGLQGLELTDEEWEDIRYINRTPHTTGRDMARRTLDKYEEIYHPKLPFHLGKRPAAYPANESV